jgi:hypothetical protein
MSVVDSLLRFIIGGSDFRSREFLRPTRVRAGVRAGHDLEWRSVVRSDAAMSLRARLLYVRRAANGVASSAVSSATAAGSGVTVSSSRSDAVSADAVGGGARSGSAIFHVKVTNLAVAQVNEGQELTSSDTNAIQAGTNTFTIKVGTGAATTVSFTNDSTDTYAEVLENLASTINEADAGATASVVEDEDGGTVQLVLTADATGLGSAFTVADVTGNVVSAIGFGSSTIAAEKAEFFVNGIPKTSDSNTVLIDRGRVRLSFNEETGPTGDDDEPGAVISVKPDSLSEAVVKLTSSLNGLRSFIKSDGSAQARRIGGIFDKLLAGRKTDLEGIGIAIDGNSQLTVKRDVLERAIETSRSTVNALLSPAGGLGETLSGAASNALAGLRVRLQHAALLGSDGSFPGSPLIGPARDSWRGVLVDVLG